MPVGIERLDDDSGNGFAVPVTSGIGDIALVRQQRAARHIGGSRFPIER